MLYKDLINKINSDMPNEYIKRTREINPARKNVQIKDILIGLIINPTLSLSPQSVEALKSDIARKLTVLLNSPIGANFAFMPYDIKALNLVTSQYPEYNCYYITNKNTLDPADKTEFSTDISGEYKSGLPLNDDLTLLDTIKTQTPSLKIVFKSDNKKTDFFDKIDYLITINISNTTSIDKFIKFNSINVFDLTFVETSANPLVNYKGVTPDPGGWVYNPANGMWSKAFGWDGSQTFKSWDVNADWQLNGDPTNTQKMN